MAKKTKKKAKAKAKRKTNKVPAAKTKRNAAIIKAFLKGESAYSIGKKTDGVSPARVQHIIGNYLMREYREGRLVVKK